MSTLPYDESSSIAIIGMAGRFPGAKTLDAFWENLKNGTDVLRHFSEEDLRGRVPPEVLRAPNFIKAGYVLDDAEQFDADFFGFTPRQAAYLDPQQRLFLECAWEALENAGYASPAGANTVGVYAGAAISTYMARLMHEFSPIEPTKFFDVLLGNDKDYLATRVCYKLNLRGPGVSVQSACSSSLVAVCQACQGLLAYQVDMALAGGVSISFPQDCGFLCTESDGFISRTAQCRAFDAGASGIVAGNGLGIVVLKRLEDARKDKDTIYGVIRGFAMNNDGSAKVGFTAPGLESQCAVITEALAMADVPPESIGYVEAHGTGTALGDPIEVAALTKAYGGMGGKTGICPIGSVKTNIGHLNTAAGVASLIKVLLALRHEMLPPSLHFEAPNPEIHFEKTPFYVNADLAPWKTNAHPRRAGVSSFGFGGTNAHLILEEPPKLPPVAADASWHVLTLSARSEAALNAMTARLAARLRADRNISLADAAFTLQAGRKAFNLRTFVVARDAADAVSGLEAFASAETPCIRKSQDTAPPLVFVLPTHDTESSCLAAGAELYTEEPAFRKAVDACAERLLPLIGSDVRDVFRPETAAKEKESPPATSLPVLFTFTYAAAELLRSKGAEPTALVGRGIGEYVAAVLAGVFSLEDALTLVVRRDELLRAMPARAVYEAEAAPRLVEQALPAGARIEADHGTACLVSVAEQATGELEEALKRHNITHGPAGNEARPRLLDPESLPAFQETLETVSFGAPSLSVASGVTGQWLSNYEALDKNYWLKQASSPAKLGEAIALADKAFAPFFIDVSPDGASSPAANAEHFAAVRIQEELPTLPEYAQFLRLLGGLWSVGHDVTLYGEGPHSRIPLPTYPFERRAYAVEPRAASLTTGDAVGNQPKESMDEWFYTPSWRLAPLPAASAPQANAEELHTWLIFQDAEGVGEALAARQRQAGRMVSLVAEGESFAANGDGTFLLNPASRGDYDVLFRRLAEDGRMPNVIAYCRDISPATESVADTAHEALLQIMRAAAERQLDRKPLRLGIITTGLRSVTGKEPVSPEKALLLGPGRVIPNEFPAVRCVTVDLEQPLQLEELAALAAHVEAELTALSPEPAVVAYRNGRRWVESFEPVRLASPSSTNVPLRENGTYVVTGGLGGVGFALAEHLASHLRAKLVLVGRTALPAESERGNWLATHAEDDKISALLRRVAALEAAGAEVLVAQADVADKTRMRAVFQEARQRFGAVHGIIHAAGVAGGGLIASGTLGASNIGAKVKGTRILGELCKEFSPDFLLLCSSLAAYGGVAGSADYTATNAFLDAYAESAALPCRVVGVNWNFWFGVGMGTGVSADAADNVVDGMHPEQGVEAFVRILASGLSRVVVCTRDLPRLLASVRAEKSVPAQSPETADSGATLHARPEIGVVYAEPRTVIERTIADVWQALLGIERIGVDDPFLDIGGDSLLAITLDAELRNIFHIKLPLNVVFSHDTVAKLAAYLVDNEERGGGTEKAAELYQRVRSMTPEQVAAMLHNAKRKE